MSAGVSKNVKTAETESPMHRTGLRRLQRMIDEMTDEVPRICTFKQLSLRAVDTLDAFDPIGGSFFMRVARAIYALYVLDFLKALDALTETYESIESS